MDGKEDGKERVKRVKLEEEEAAEAVGKEGLSNEYGRIRGRGFDHRELDLLYGKYFDDREKHDFNESVTGGGTIRYSR